MTDRSEKRWEKLKDNSIILQSLIKTVISEYLAVEDLKNNGENYNDTVSNGMAFFRKSLANLEKETFLIFLKDLNVSPDKYWKYGSKTCVMQIAGKKYEFDLSIDMFDKLIDKYKSVVIDKTSDECQELFELCKVLWFMLIAEMDKIKPIDKCKIAKFDELSNKRIQDYLPE